jgi:hypothetical protein
MRERVRRARAAFAALLALAALGSAPAGWSACPDMAGGIGGTGAVARGGVGGTGMPEVPSMVGVIGVVSEFGSVCVNGLEIHYDESTPVTINGRPGSAGQLALGQVVAVEARSADGRFVARNVEILRVVEGPVTSVDAGAWTVFVMGQAVRVTEETVSTLPGPRLAEIPVNATVQVSGFRNARGQIVASRFDVAPPQDEHSVIGPLRQRDAGTGEIGDVTVSLPDASFRGERDVLVRGRWDGERLRAGAVVDAPATRLLGRVERAVVESLVLEAGRGYLRVGEHDIHIGRRTSIEASLDLRIGQRVRVTGVPDRRGGIAAEHIEIPRAGPRPAVPGRGGEGGANQNLENGGGGRGESSGLAGSERVERDDTGLSRGERPDSSGPGRPEHAAGSGRVERPERAEKPEKVDKPERAAKPERVEKPERGDRAASKGGGP